MVVVIVRYQIKYVLADHILTNIHKNKINYEKLRSDRSRKPKTKDLQASPFDYVVLQN